MLYFTGAENEKILIILICFMGALSSCASDYAAETHITFTNNSSHEISILNTEYTDFEPSVLVSKNCSVSKTVDFQGEGIKIVFTSNSLKYEAALCPSESRWFTIRHR